MRHDTAMQRLFRLVAAKNILIQLGTLALSFPLSILVSRHLGPEGRGVFSLTSMTAAVVALAAGLGIAEATPYVVGRHHREQGTEGVLARALLLPLIVSVALFVPLGMGVLPLLGVQTTVPLLTVAVILMALLANWPFWLNMATAQARTEAAIKAEAMRVIVYFLMAVSAIVAGVLTAPVALLALAISYVVTLAVVVWRIRPIMRRPNPARERAIRTEAMRLGWRGMVARLLEYGSSRVDVFIVGGVLGAGAAGTYAVATGIAALTTMTAAANIPAVLHRLSTAPSAWGRFLLGRVLGSAGLAAVGAILIIVFARIFVTFALGDAFGPVVAPLKVLAVAAIVLGTSRILRQANFALGRMHANWWSDLTSIAILVVGNLWFLRSGGLISAAFVILIAHVAATTILALGLVRASHRPGASPAVPLTPSAIAPVDVT